MSNRIRGQRNAQPTASEINRWNEASRKNGSLQEQKNQKQQQSLWVWVKNNTGSAVARGDTLSLGEPLAVDGLDVGNVDLIFAATDADADSDPVILLEGIDSGDLGKGVIHGMALAKVEGGSGSRATPNTSNKLEPGDSGPIKILATPDASTEKLLPVLIEGSGSAEYRFAALLEDTSSTGEVLAREYDKTGTPVSPENLFHVYNWNGVINRAKAGFFALYSLSGSDWIYTEGLSCITDCSHSGTLSVASEMNFTEEEVITDQSVTATGMNSVSMIGALPSGLTYTSNPSSETGGTISGTPAAGTAGTSYVQFQGVAPKSGGSPGETCTVTRAVLITISE